MHFLASQEPLPPEDAPYFDCSAKDVERITAYLMARRQRWLKQAARAIRSTASAEDLVQDVFVNVLHMAGEGRLPPRTPSALDAYVTKAVTLRAKTFWRGKQRENAHLVEEVADALLQAHRERVESMADEAIFWADHDALPANEWVAFHLHIVLGFSYKQAANVLGVAPNTVKNRVRKAIQRMKEMGPENE